MQSALRAPLIHQTRQRIVRWTQIRATSVWYVGILEEIDLLDVMHEH
jgi:hypothetical protein